MSRTSPQRPQVLVDPVDVDNKRTLSRETVTMKMRSARTPFIGLFLAVTLSACQGAGDELASQRATRSNDPFCQEALAAVDSFMSSVIDRRKTGGRYGGTVQVGANAELAGGMGALTSPDFGANQHHKFVNLMSLIRYNSDLEPVPYLAEHWTVSDDGTDLIFHLRDDVRWHDGVLTTAYDVAFTVDRAMNPETGFPNDSYWSEYENDIEVVDSFTVRLRLRPHNEFMDVWRSLAILPAHLLKDVPPNNLAQHPYNTQCPVGNGPFVFAEHVSGERWVFHANPAFPDAIGGQPFLDRYIYRAIPEQATLLSELLTHGIDVYVAPLPEQVALIEAAEDLEARVYDFRAYLMAAWNGRLPKLADRRVRKAITMGINRAEILEVVRLGMGTIANGTIPPYHWGYNPEMETILPYNPEGARALLREAGWEDRDGDGVVENLSGEPLTLTIKTNPNQEREDVAEIMQAQLAEIGIALNIRLVDFGTLVGDITGSERDFEGFLIAFTGEFRVDDADMFMSDRGDVPYAFSGLADESLDELLRKIPNTLERSEAIPLLQEYQRQLAEAQPYTFLYFSDRIQGVNRRVHDAVMDVRGAWVNLADWWIPEDQRR